MKKYPHVAIVKLTDEQQKYLNQFAISGGRNAFIRALIDTEMKLEAANAIGLSSREMDIFIKRSSYGS